MHLGVIGARRDIAIRMACLSVLVALFLALSAASAFAASAVTNAKFSGPVAYELKSLLTTRFTCDVDTAGSWGRLDILGANGVVKTIYNGPLVAGTNWFPIWNGLDSAGRRMPSASYDWRLTVSKAGESTVVRGKITVSKIHFMIKGGPTDPEGDFYIRYMVPGNANIYVQATTAEPYDMFAFAVGYAPAEKVIYATDVLDVTSASPYKGTFYMRGAEATPYRGNHVVIVAGDIAPYYTMTFIQ